MSRLAVIAAVLTILQGCAAKLNFIDRSNGNIYHGQTGGTASDSGDASVIIDGIPYSGPWIYSSAGGSYTLGGFSSSSSAVGTVSSGLSTATASGYGSTSGSISSLSVSAQGGGLINLRSDNSLFIRCVFEFNSFSNTGLGQCMRNDGREYDLTIKR